MDEPTVTIHEVSDFPATLDPMKNYTYRAQWSIEYGDYEGICLEFPSETTHAATAREAIARMEETISGIIADYEQEDADPPPSIADRHYSGTFLVRTSAMLHGRLMIESAEQGVSLNQWVVQKLAERKSAASLDPFF